METTVNDSTKIQLIDEVPRPITIKNGSAGFSQYAARADHEHSFGAEAQNYLGSLRGRNLLDNGALNISQQGTVFPGLSAVAVARKIDRWRLYSPPVTAVSTNSTIADAPSNTGFNRCIEVLVTTAKPALVASDEINIGQEIDGYRIWNTSWGKPWAKPTILSFWVKSNLPGKYVAELVDFSSLFFCRREYQIAQSGVWEKKTLVFPPRTTSGLTLTTSTQLVAQFFLACGTDLTSGTEQVGWQNTAANRAVGQVNLFATVNNYIRFTGIQLENSVVETPFEFLDVQTELNVCQKWRRVYGGADLFQPLTPYGACLDASNLYIPLWSDFRKTPVASSLGNLETVSSNNTAQNINGLAIIAHDGQSGYILVTSAALFTAGLSAWLRAKNDLNARLILSAE